LEDGSRPSSQVVGGRHVGENEPRDQRANRRRHGSRGGRPTGFDKAIYRGRNEVERTIKRLKNVRAIATRFGKRAYVLYGTVTVAAIRLWLGPE
jgi:transposase